MVKSFVYNQVIVQFRTPVNDDGSLGQPEIIKKFVSNIGAPKGVAKKIQSNLTLDDDKEEVTI